MGRFEEAFGSWTEKRLAQEAAAQLLGVCPRTFRRYVDRYHEDGIEGLIDKRMSQVSSRRAPADEALRLEAPYRERHEGWTAAHFHEWYREKHGGERSYTWVKNRLQESGQVGKGRARGKYRKKRERAPLAGMLVHRDGSTREWAPDAVWDPIVTLDDAAGEACSGFFVEEEGAWSSFRGVRETAQARGLFPSFRSDRGSHCRHTPEAGGKADKSNPTQFGRAMGELGIEMIPSCSPQARGRSERHFETIQGRLPNELAPEGVRDMGSANECLRERFWPACDKRFAAPAREDGDAFVPLGGVDLDDILRVKEERVVGHDNCVGFGNRSLRNPPGPRGRRCVRRRVRSTNTPTGGCRCSTARDASPATRPTARRPPQRERQDPSGLSGALPPNPRSTWTLARSGRPIRFRGPRPPA